MSNEIVQIRIQSRVDMKENWIKENPTLLDKEIGYERETGKYKIGDGIHEWNDLLYSSVGNEGITVEQFNALNSIVNDKVDKIQGKNLSTNDFTNDYKNKVDNLNSIIDTKVDKISGKTLSSNDFTNDYKTKIDNTEHLVEEKIAALIDSAPETLDTLNELAKALGNDPNFATTVLNQLSQKADITYVNNLFNSIVNGEEVYY